MNISLPSALEKYVQDKVATGCYSTASEVVREGLRLLQEQDKLAQMRLEELRREIQIGIDQVERGEVVRYNSVKELVDDVTKRGIERLAKRKHAKKG